MARIPERAMAGRRGRHRCVGRMVWLRHQRPTRPAQDSVDGRPDARRQRSHRPHPGLACRHAECRGPTLNSLSGDFGLAPLIGKTLAVVADMRISGRDTSIVVERLLSICGEDTLTVNRKYRDQWTGKLSARFHIISNELPQLGDASAAIIGRFIMLVTTRSWLGKEDRELEPALQAELPGF